MISLKVLQMLAQLGKEEITCISEIHYLELSGSPNGDRGWWKNQFSKALTLEFYPNVFRLFDGSGMEQKFYNI
jgi:hypothetical protein